jgi:ubiquinone/menaquinone biosynthesis C-methylase UbiE
MTVDFDAKAKDWDSEPRRIERAQAVAQAIRQRVHLVPSMTAFEYGCGTGLLSFALQPYLGHITLADSSPGMLAVLEDKIRASSVRNMTPIKLNLSSDPPPPGRYHLIYTLMTLHHIPDTEKILQGFCTLLESGGILCIADLDLEDGSFHGPGFAGHNGFDRYEFKETLERAGFRHIAFTTCYEMKKQIEGSLRTFPLFLMVGEKAPINGPI